jgi:hypothetical protein
MRAFGRFWYHFIIGDDWTIAATVVGALLLTWLVAAWWVAPLAAAAVIGLSLRRTAR